MPRPALHVIAAAVVGALMAAGAIGAIAAVAAAPAWTTYRHDAGRSGIDPDSTIPVTPAQAWRTPAAYTGALDGQVYGQPLVYGSRVYVATENDTLYALDAATGAVVWQNHLATPESSGMAPCGDITPTIGITSTPVIDPASNRIYAVGSVSDGATAASVKHELFTVDLGTGALLAATAVDPAYPAGGGPRFQLQRPALTLLGDRILIGYGGNDGDCATYWGWFVSAPTDGTAALRTFQVDAGAGHTGGAIWAAGNGPPVDTAGNVVIATGNGAGNSSSSPDYGDSVVKLDANLAPLGFWAPSDWATLDSTDADLGSSMPALLPGNLLFQAGKDGNAYVLNGASLGGVSAPVAALRFCSGGTFGGAVYHAATSTIYAACASGLKALTLTSGPTTGLVPKAGFAAPSAATGPPIIAGGLVWSTNYHSGTLYGLDLATGAGRYQAAIPETGTNVNHFSVPSAGGGRLFVASGSQVTAFTIAAAAGPSATTTKLAASPNPSAAAAAVTFTATVAPAPDAGTVAFTDGGVPIPGCTAVAVNRATGRASCRETFARSGSHRIAGVYSGDPYYTPSTSTPLTQTVAPAGGRLAGPRITLATISPARFTARGGATLRLTLSRPATITVAVTEVVRGHMVHGRCSLRSRQGRACRVRVTRMRLRFRGHAGANAFKLAMRQLAAGHYLAIVVASAHTGRRSRQVPLRLTVVS